MPVQIDESARFHTASADAIAALAKEVHQPLPIVKRAYDAEFARLGADAKVRTYLVLLASRSARERLRRASW